MPNIPRSILTFLLSECKAAANNKNWHFLHRVCYDRFTSSMVQATSLKCNTYFKALCSLFFFFYKWCNLFKQQSIPFILKCFVCDSLWATEKETSDSVFLPFHTEQIYLKPKRRCFDTSKPTLMRNQTWFEFHLRLKASDTWSCDKLSERCHYTATSCHLLLFYLGLFLMHPLVFVLSLTVTVCACCCLLASTQSLSHASSTVTSGPLRLRAFLLDFSRGHGSQWMFTSAWLQKSRSYSDSNIQIQIIALWETIQHRGLVKSHWWPIFAGQGVYVL